LIAYTKARKARAKGGIRAGVAAFKRDQIVAAAVELFLAYGYHGTSIDSIAEALGVSKPFIYYHFKSKTDILSAISHHGAQLTLSAVAEAEEHAGDPAERMTRFCHRLATIVIENGRYLAVYCNETNNLHATDRKAILKLRDEIDRRISVLVRDGVRAGHFSVDDPLVATRAITGMISFMWTWAHHLDSNASAVLAKQMTRIALQADRRIAGENELRRA
jgi:AcrR family transcriptional regulator